MARKGKKVVHTYKLKHMDKWKKLQESVPEEGKSVTETTPTVPKVNKNVNQMWDWNTLEDVV